MVDESRKRSDMCPSETFFVQAHEVVNIEGGFSNSVKFLRFEIHPWGYMSSPNNITIVECGEDANLAHRLAQLHARECQEACRLYKVYETIDCETMMMLISCYTVAGKPISERRLRAADKMFRHAMSYCMSEDRARRRASDYALEDEE